MLELPIISARIARNKVFFSKKTFLFQSSLRFQLRSQTQCIKDITHYLSINIRDDVSDRHEIRDSRLSEENQKIATTSRIRERKFEIYPMSKFRRVNSESRFGDLFLETDAIYEVQRIGRSPITSIAVCA